MPLIPPWQLEDGDERELRQISNGNAEKGRVCQEYDDNDGRLSYSRLVQTYA